MTARPSPRAEVEPDLVTTSRAMTDLGINRDQVVRLVTVGLLPEHGRRGRARLLSAADVANLASRPLLTDTPDAAGAESYALALHLGPLAADPHPSRNQRAWTGWQTGQPVPDTAWTGWWNTGPAIADDCAERRLTLLPAVSGIVVDARTITGWQPHPLYSGLVQFTVEPPTPEVHAALASSRLRPTAGAPWQRLWTDPETAPTQPVSTRPQGS